MASAENNICTFPNAELKPAFQFAPGATEFPHLFFDALGMAVRNAQALEGDARAVSIAQKLQQELFANIDSSRRSAYNYMQGPLAKSFESVDEMKVASEQTRHEAAFRQANENFESERKLVKEKCEAMMKHFGVPTHELLATKLQADEATKVWTQCNSFDEFISSWIANGDLTHCQVVTRVIELRKQLEPVLALIPEPERAAASTPNPQKP